MDRPSDRFAVATVELTIYDINDHKPEMDRTTYVTSVIESARLNTVVTTVSAHDADRVGLSVCLTVFLSLFLSV